MTTIANDKKPKTIQHGNDYKQTRQKSTELRYLGDKSLRSIAEKARLNVNGTRKQRDVLEAQDLMVFIGEYAKLCFKPNTPCFEFYVKIIKTKFQQLGLKTIKAVIQNIFYLNKENPADTQNVIFTQQQLDVLLRLGTEWLHYQHPPKQETDKRVYLENVAHAIKFSDSIVQDMETHFAARRSPRNMGHKKSPPDYCLATTEDQAYITNGSKKTLANIWLGDSGASCHMTNDDSGMFDFKTINDNIKIGNGRMLKATKIGKKKVIIKQMDGQTKAVTLEGVKYVPDLSYNLFSITKALISGWHLSNKGVHIVLSKGPHSFTFDKEFKTQTGMLLGIELIPDCAMTTIDINYFHQSLGHPSVDIMKNTAQHHNIKLSGDLDKCYECAISKAKATKISKINNNKSTTKGERLYVDISYIKQKSYGGSKFWLLIVDEATGMSWSSFLKEKSQLPEKVIGFVKKLAKENIMVKFIRCDGEGENKILGKELENLPNKITIEFTGPSTPQYNGKVERKFATLWSKVRAVLNNAKLDEKLRNGLWAEAANHCTLLENMLVPVGETKSAYEKFYGVKPDFEGLHPFGELVVVTNMERIKGKLEDKGKPMLYVGNPPNHPKSVIKALNLQTKQMISSRNIKWMGKMYGVWKNLKKDEIVVKEDPEEEVPQEEEKIQLNEEQDQETYHRLPKK